MVGPIGGRFSERRSLRKFVMKKVAKHLVLPALVLLIPFLSRAVILAQDQSGFISIDYGLPANNTYADSREVINMPNSQTKHEEVEAMMNIKLAYGVTTRNWQGDPCAPEAFIWDGVKCTFDTSNTSRIISLNLSSAELSGIISPDLSNLKFLQVLDLSYNSLVGPVPDFLVDLPFLKVINLSENNLTGAIPAKLLQKSKRGSLSLSLDGNLYLCQKEPCNYTNKEGQEGTKVKDVRAIVVGTATVSLLIILFAAMVLFCHLRFHRNRGLGIGTSETLSALLHNPHVLGVHRKGWIEI